MLPEQKDAHGTWGAITAAIIHDDTCRYIMDTCIRADLYYEQCTRIRADINAHVYVRIYIMGNAHVYVQIYYRHMYTCGYIFLMLLRLAVHICIRADTIRAHVYVRRYIYYGLSVTT